MHEIHENLNLTEITNHTVYHISFYNDFIYKSGALHVNKLTDNNFNTLR